MKDGSGCLAGSIGIYADEALSSTKSPSSVRGRMEMDDGEILKQQRCRHDAGGLFLSCRGSNKAVAEYMNRKNWSSSGDMTQISVVWKYGCHCVQSVSSKEQ